MKSVLSLIALLFAVCACGPTEQAKIDPNTLSIEQKFITVSTGKLADSSDPAVARAKELLDRASVEYKTTRDLAADQAYTTAKIAQKDGVNVTAMEVLEAVALSYVQGAGIDFPTAAAMYVSIRKSGLAHAETMMGMKGMIATVNDMAKAPSRR